MSHIYCNGCMSLINYYSWLERGCLHITHWYNFPWHGFTRLRRLQRHLTQRRTTQWHWFVFSRDCRATTFNSRYYRTDRQANKQTARSAFGGLDPSDNLIRISLHHPIRHITAKSAGHAPSFDITSSFWPATVVVVQFNPPPLSDCYTHYWK